MATIGAAEIVERVFDILRADPRTSRRHWLKGQHSLLGVQQVPAGLVFLWTGGLGLEWVTIPDGVRAILPIGIRVAHSDAGGIDRAEQEVQQGLSAVLEVLASVPSLGGIDRVVGFDVEIIDVDSNAEAAPPYAEALLVVRVEVRSQG